MAGEDNRQVPSPKSVGQILNLSDGRPCAGDKGVRMLLQVPGLAKLDWADLRGKVVVLEFWATWCGPCVAAIRHWNKLVEKFAGQSVVFVSITDEEEDHIRKFLEKRPVAGWLALDLDRSMFNAFSVPARPHTVVADGTGKIAAMTTPEHLTEETLQRVLSGQPAGVATRAMRVPNLRWDREEIDWRDGIQPELQLIVKPVQIDAGGHAYQPGSNRFTADGALLANLLQVAFETDYFHMDCRFPMPEQKYRVSVVVPGGREATLLPFLRSALTTMFDLSTRWELQDKEVYVLRRVGGGKPTVQASQSEGETYYFMRGKIGGQKQPIAKLVDALTNFLGKPVVDETGLSGRYDWDLNYEPGLAEFKDSLLAEFFSREVFALLLGEELISEDLAEKIASWRHSGFSVHSKVKPEPGKRPSGWENTCVPNARAG